MYFCWWLWCNDLLLWRIKRKLRCLYTKYSLCDKYQLFLSSGKTVHNLIKKLGLNGLEFFNLFLEHLYLLIKSIDGCLKWATTSLPQFSKFIQSQNCVLFVLLRFIYSRLNWLLIHRFSFNKLITRHHNCFSQSSFFFALFFRIVLWIGFRTKRKLKIMKH